MDAYIISYFGESTETKLQRQAMHYQQLCCVLKQPGIEHIHILAQDYHNQEVVTRPQEYLYMPSSRITYHTAKRCSPAQARNQLMEVFYDTGKSWALFMDNDAVIDPRWHGADICNIIEHNQEWLNHNVDILTPMSPRHQAFNTYITQEQDKGNLKTHVPIQKLNYIKTTVFWMRNRSLTGDAMIKFDETLHELEDFEYVGRVLQQGGLIYQIKSVIMNDIGLHLSTLFEGKERTTNFEEIKRKIYARYFDVTQWRGAQDTPFRWDTIGVNRFAKREYKLPMVHTEGTVLDTQDNTFHLLFE